jgi:Uma2 family endonuclease
MFQYKPQTYYSSSEELPNLPETPLDNELQYLIPGMLKGILALNWIDRFDWFFGIHIGIYYDSETLSSETESILPDGFLSLGVERFCNEEKELRLSYSLWEEDIVPSLALEVVSHIYRGEYTQKKTLYAELGVLYYVIYSPRRRQGGKLDVYRLVDSEYILQPGNLVWLPEIGLGIGTERGTYQGITREWLYWYNESGERLLTPEERINQAESRTQKLEAKLRALGIDPETLS